MSQGLQTHSNIIDARINSRGQDYYWLAGDLDCGKEDVPTDVEYARKGYITGVTLTWKQQDNAAMHTLTNILEKYKKFVDRPLLFLYNYKCSETPEWRNGRRT